MAEIADKERNVIDSLKGIGILGIILVHYGLTSSNELISGIVFNGARGVQLMYVINGFLIFHSLSKINGDRKSIRDWYIGKFARLIPLYYFFTLLHLIVFGTGERYWIGTFTEVSWINILSNFLFLHGFHPYFINAINENWFMANIAIFYIIAPFLAKKVNSLEKSIIVLLLLVPAGFVLKSVVIDWDIMEVHSIWNDYVNILSFLSELPIIMLGILCYFLYKKHVITKKGEKFISYACLIAVVIPLYSLFLNKDYFIVYNNIFTFGLIFSVVLLSQLIYPLKAINNHVFGILGKHSYGIYLSHIFIISLLKNIGITGDNENIGVRILGFFVSIILSLLTSIIAEQTVEKYMNKLFQYIAMKKDITLYGGK